MILRLYYSKNIIIIYILFLIFFLYLIWQSLHLRTICIMWVVCILKKCEILLRVILFTSDITVYRIMFIIYHNVITVLNILKFGSLTVYWIINKLYNTWNSNMNEYYTLFYKYCEKINKVEKIYIKFTNPLKSFTENIISK